MLLEIRWILFALETTFFKFWNFGDFSIFGFIKLVYFWKQDDSYFRTGLVSQRPLR